MILWTGILIACIFAFYIIFTQVQKYQEEKRIQTEIENQQKRIQTKAEEKAQSICTCYATYEAEMQKELKTFLLDFDKKQYSKKTVAEENLEEITKNIQSQKEDCISDVKSNTDFYESLTYEERRKFNSTVEENKKSCNKEYDYLSSESYKSIEQKMQSIKAPEPTIDMIKSDLIGKKVPLWTFDYLSEFRDTKVISTEKYNDNTTLEYIISTILYAEKKKQRNEAILIVYYKKQNEEWKIDSVKLKSISFVRTIPAGERWLIVDFLKGYTFTFDNTYKLFWKYNINVSGGIKTGPWIKGIKFSFEKECLRYNMKCNVKSLEGKEVGVKFTYTLEE